CRRFVGVMFALSDMALDVFNHDDSVVDDQAGSEGDAEQGQRVDGETQQFHKDEGADERNRSGDEVNHRRPPVAEKDKDHQDNQKDRRTYRVDYVADGLAHSVGGVECDFVVHSGREFFREPLQFGNGAPVDVERIRGGELSDAHADCVLTVKLQVRTVIFRAQFGAAYILQADQGAVGIRLENYVLELASLAEAPNRAHADLILLSLRGRLLTHLPGRYFHILLGKSVHYIRRGQSPSRHAHRIQPQPHGILALAENNYVSHARNTLQRIPDVNIEVVAHEQRGVFVVVGDNGGAKNEILRTLRGRDANRFHGGGQPSLCCVDTVFDVARGQVRIPVYVKGESDTT